MDSEVSKCVEVYTKVCRIPTPTSVFVFPGSTSETILLRSIWSSTDFNKMEKCCFSRDYVVDTKNCNVLSNGIANGISGVVFQAVSTSGKRQAILRKEKSSEEKMFLEIWNETQIENVFDMTERKEHGKIIENDVFGCFQWSANEKYLLYSSEETKAKGVAFFKDSPSSAETKTAKGEEYAYKEDWGEQNLSQHPVLCVIDASSGKIDVLTMDSVNPYVSMGQGVWGPNDENVVFVGWEEIPRRIGVVFCTNRRNAIYSINLKNKEIERLTTSDDICANSPRFSPDYSSFIFLENDSGGPHHSCRKLRKYDMSTKKISTIVDIIDDPKSKDDFPGIYLEKLPLKCWSEDGNHVFFSGQWRSKVVLLDVNMKTCQVKKVDTDETVGSLVLLGIHKNVLVANASSFSKDPSLLIGMFEMEGQVVWKQLDTVEVRNSCKWDIINLKPTAVNEQYRNLDYEIILVTPTDTNQKLPLIVFPHGGPHSAFSCGFQQIVVSLVNLGFLVCLVNYRGSIGFGNNSVKSLLGNVGSQDVMDVHQAALYVKNSSVLDIGDVFIFGGSHGGFLGAHLTGQYPDFYKAASLRNPVIDISVMISLSDIPDWSWVESGLGLKYYSSKVIDSTALKTMWEKSPIRYSEKVQAPTLLLLGSKDLRVPLSQSINYYHFLKSRNIPVKVFLYDDNHSLSKPNVNGDQFMQTVLWFKEHSSVKQDLDK